MGIFSRFENKMEDTVEGAASRLSNAPISPVQIAKKAEKQMRRETMVGAGREYAPTLYTVLVNPDDDARLFGYYPTLAGETETYLKAKASQNGLIMDGNPLVRFIVDDALKHGKFEVIAEAVSAPIIEQLREEEMYRYGISPKRAPMADMRHARAAGYDNAAMPNPAAYANAGAPASYVDPASPARHTDRANAAGLQNATSVQDPSRAVLINLQTNASYPLKGSIFTLGRDTSNSIPINDINASRQHAQLSLNQRGVWLISDLHSTNGTQVNGMRVSQQELYMGDIITIGKSDFEFMLE